jgi:hypothetical protein
VNLDQHKSSKLLRYRIKVLIVNIDDQNVHEFKTVIARYDQGSTGRRIRSNSPDKHTRYITRAETTTCGMILLRLLQGSILRHDPASDDLRHDLRHDPANLQLHDHLKLFTNGVEVFRTNVGGKWLLPLDGSCLSMALGSCEAQMVAI